MAALLIEIAAVTYVWSLNDYESYQQSKCWENGSLCKVYVFDLLYRDAIVAAISGTIAAAIGTVAVVVERRANRAKVWRPISISAIILFAVFTGYFFTISSWTMMVRPPLGI